MEDLAYQHRHFVHQIDLPVDRNNTTQLHMLYNVKKLMYQITLIYFLKTIINNCLLFLDDSSNRRLL
ncbi:Uncharacterized protein TCM_008130 [Theobroma cacao]|uniref:Uncharacterized protein n=1 Tax=Theobroma cacao TaxID=3641 RepID=A0A061E486_THECC|nr:Uncharacterized protein TCM_008130 [Theobroma cacao]